MHTQISPVCVVEAVLRISPLLFSDKYGFVQICFENKMGSQCVRFNPCMHVFCKDCVSGFFAERLNNLEVLFFFCRSYFKEGQTVNLGSCTMCGYSFCVLCFRAYHGVDDCNFKSGEVVRGLPCNSSFGAESSKRSLQNIVNNLLNDGWMEGNSKPCPRCRVRIEKSDGCNKMQCTKCDAMFCWLCERILDRNDPYAHFNEGGLIWRSTKFHGVHLISFLF
ncbi:unnamed protein product [Haemonchus placei]|uniref:RBR-type E3 ubiquitin transferase n=1 Tax=Haemonchus placei TaxID=6290 RepID=A0A0N4W5H4_HAEPC|nr:unnamed protein product [Haemonchus placei]